MEYYVVEKKNNLGEQYIELSVFQSITTHEMSKIEGVDFDGGKGAVNVEINDHNQVVIDLNICIDYGLNEKLLTKFKVKLLILLIDILVLEM
jgi:uncharacterized alkaline shock family protein YloU